MARYMQPFVVTIPPSRPQRRHFYEQPTLEHEFAEILSDLVSTKRSSLATQTVHDNSVFKPFWCDFVRASSKRPWVNVINFAGFEAGDIDVKVEGRNMLVRAKREQSEGGNSDIMERKPEVKLPSDVDAEKIACFLSEDGRFIIKAPYASNAREELKQPCEETESKHAAPMEAKEVPVRLEGKKGSSEQDEAPEPENAQEKQSRQPGTTSLADFIVSALTGDFPTGNSPRSDSPVPGGNNFMLDNGKGEKRDLTPLTDNTDVIEEDGKKFYCVKVKLPSYPTESIKVRSHGRNMFIDAKREVEEPGIFHRHEFHCRY